VHEKLLYARARPSLAATDMVYSNCQNFFRSGTPYNSPLPPFKKGGNYKEMQAKSPFEKGGFSGNAVQLTPEL
jgi:hypothetical protein